MGPATSAKRISSSKRRLLTPLLTQTLSLARAETTRVDGTRVALDLWKMIKNDPQKSWAEYMPAYSLCHWSQNQNTDLICFCIGSWTCATMCNKPLWNCSHVLFNPWFLGKRQMAACRYHQPGPCKPTTYHSPMHLWSQRSLQMILSHSYHRGQKDKLFSEVLVKNPVNTKSDNLGSISIWFQSFPGGIFPKAKLVTGLVVICFSATGPQWPSWYPSCNKSHSFSAKEHWQNWRSSEDPPSGLGKRAKISRLFFLGGDE